MIMTKSKMSLTSGQIAVTSKTKSNGGNRKVNPENLFLELEKCLDNEVFYAIAEQMLEEVSDIGILIQAATFVRQRVPGGTYYSAYFWAKILTVLNKDNHSTGARLKIQEECERLRLDYSILKPAITEGSLFREVLGQITDLKILREVSPSIFENARKQKGRGAEYLIEAIRYLAQKPNISAHEVHQNWCRLHGSIRANLDIIKPSDWWAFSHPKWRQEEDFPGSIPGEVYANALYYFAPLTGVAIDAMAGSGMFKRVYDEKEKWQRDLDFQLEIYLFDIDPRRDYIQYHDASEPLPLMADWIFLDPPYFGQSAHLYEGILARTKNYQEYLELMQRIIKAMTDSLNPSGRLCILLPKWSGLNFEDPNYDMPNDVYKIAIDLELKWIDSAHVSRGRQQEAGSALKNNAAKRRRRMRSDTCILNVFEK